ncbi:hypothetical protein R1flu_010808 [Riccia fluitans]|uniref:Retrotransposon gag domain-containing protein n=1 Tax=Riccia fluitans TaxID=41844 RepID=A0ABD1Z611_9MARC
METSRKGKEKVIESSHRPDVDTDVDIPTEERRTLKIGMMANHLEMDPPLSTPTGQTSGRGSNHIPASDTMKEVPPTSSKLPSDGIMEESIANHPGTIGGFENLNLTIIKKWVEIPTLNLEEFEKCPADYPDFVRGHRTFQDEVDRTGIDVYYQSLLKALKAVVGTLPNSLVVFEYMRSIFDSYVNPTNDPNVQPLVKGLDADEISVDKFFDLQDPTTPDDAQASPDFEEDLRTNEHVRLRLEVRNLGAKPQRLTRSTCVCLEYEPTILPDVAPTNNPARPITLDLTVDAREDPSSLP